MPISPPRLPDDLPRGFVVHPQVLALIDTPQFVQRTPEWYDRRKTLMTASNSAGALGIKPYDSFRGDAREECLKNLVSGTFKGNVATQHGVDHEDQVRDRFCEIMGETCLDFGLLVHPRKPWLAASPDGITLTGLMIEIKCPYKRRIVPGEVPHHYYPQVRGSVGARSRSRVLGRAGRQYRQRVLTRAASGGAGTDPDGSV